MFPVPVRIKAVLGMKGIYKKWNNENNNNHNRILTQFLCNKKFGESGGCLGSSF